MSNEEITEVTIVEKKRRRAPSIFMNTLVLLGLCALIQGSMELSERWVQKAPSPKPVEKQIVLENLDNDKPLVAASNVAIPKEVAKKVVPKRKVAKKKVVRKKRRAKKARPVSRKPKVKKLKPYAKPDDYTSGGELDLDGQTVREKYREGNVIRVPADEASAGPVHPDESERDQFIPFEN